MSKRRNPQDKAKIVMEFFSTNITVAKLCRRHNVSPATFQDWKGMFLHGDKQALLNRGDAAKNHARDVENLKRIIGEITVPNDILKNLGGNKAMSMQAVHEISMGMSLNKALRYCGMSKRA